jgi:PD-(D/E)XK nuclease superfamily
MIKVMTILPILLPTGKQHVSYSEIREWSECSYRHNLHHVQKLGVQEPSTNLVFGTATHSVCEHFLNQKVVDLSVGTKYLDAEWEKNKDAPDFIKNPKAPFVAALIKIMADVPAFLDETFPGWELVEAEEALYEEVNQFFEKHEGIKFKGFIDIVLKVPAKKQGEFLYWILDWKTANRPWDKWKLQDPYVGMQLVLYKKFWAAKHNIPLKSIRCGFITLLKSGKPGKLCKLIPISVGEVTIDKSLKVLNNSIAGIKRGLKIKNRNNCKWCEFRDTPLCT